MSAQSICIMKTSGLMTKSFSYKLFKDDGILAIADSEILGKTFERAGLEITISKDFYHQSFCSEKEAIEMINSANIINAFGENIVNLMIKENIIQKDSVLKPCGVPHAQVFIV